MGLTVRSLHHAIAAVLAGMERQHAMLNELDGKVGDGDLGITLLKAFRELDRVKDGLPDDLGQALLACATAVSRVSSSSFGTLLATSLMTAAKASRGKTELAWTELPPLMDAAVAAMAARGKSALGDKTVLDALDAAARGATGAADPEALLHAVRAGIDRALVNYRDKPNRIGRARIFADRTIGMDDPGMVALKEMAAAL